MSNFWTKKIFLAVAAFVLFLFFSNDFGLIDIQKTAIVMATGVDRIENGFSVTAQIAVAQSSKSGQKAQDVNVTGEGKTIADAFGQINLKTGWFPKLIFCKVIILGEDTIKEDVFDCLDYFLRNEYMSDNCQLACCEGTAQDILKTQFPIDDQTALAIQKILSEEARKGSYVSANTLKDFSIGYFSDAKSGYLPYLKKDPQQEGKGEESNKDGQSGSSPEVFAPMNYKDKIFFDYCQGEESGGEKSSGGEQGEEKNLLNAGETALFYEGKKVGLLTQEESFAFNLLNQKIRIATMHAQLDGVTYSLGLKNNQSKISLVVENNLPKATLRLSASSDVLDADTSQNVEEIASAPVVPKKVLEAAENQLKKNYQSIFAKTKQTNCDLLELKDRLYKYQNRYHAAFNSDLLQRVSAHIEVEITAVR